MMETIIKKFLHLPDDRIGDNIYIAYEWAIEEDGGRRLIRIYIGSKTVGPMLQYDADGWDKFCGIPINYNNGAWTNLYSRGNFGRNYAYGGNWTSDHQNLHPRMKLAPIIEIKTPYIIETKGITVTEFDCSGTWTLWYPTARSALSARLRRDEIIESSLPAITKKHLLANETQLVIDCLNDVIEAYEL